MKLKLFACTIILGLSSFAAAQQSGTVTPPGATPPTFPQDQAPDASRPDSRPDAMPPDTRAPQHDSHDAAISDRASQTSASSSSQRRSVTVEGCLSPSSISQNGFSITDKSGNRYELQGEVSQLKDRVGHQVRISGIVSESTAQPGSTVGTGSNAPDTSGTMSGTRGTMSGTAGSSASGSSTAGTSAGSSASTTGENQRATLSVSDVRDLSSTCEGPQSTDPSSSVPPQR